MRHKHSWAYFQGIMWHTRGIHVGFDTVYECKCGMERRDRTMGLVDQKKIWEWHYYPKGTQ